ncbi:DNA primase [Mycobacterium phage Aeneas]|uniref:DNA primase n=1 Tax=Mycobacterium phage Aeneas TaxID=1168595 RepID=I3WX85_9CAUD|nr:DNA primase [Mycobacterium phage Aeneas]AFL48113.1 DNA primase [Mycobacterium phage Aeneas]
MREGEQQTEIPETPIVSVIEYLVPGWIPPDDNGRLWVACLCPFHEESRPSAAVSFTLNAFKCLSCSAKGNVITLLMAIEEVNYQTAVERAQELSPSGVAALSQSTGWVRGRGVSGNPRADRAGYRRGGDAVSPRVRGGTSTGSRDVQRDARYPLPAMGSGRAVAGGLAEVSSPRRRRG